jgi:hypothetical protein
MFARIVYDRLQNDQFQWSDNVSIIIMSVIGVKPYRLQHKEFQGIKYKFTLSDAMLWLESIDPQQSTRGMCAF